MPLKCSVLDGNFSTISRASAPAYCAGGMPSRKASVVAIRCLSSGRVDSTSSCFGMSTPASRAAAPFAVSQAICTWRFSGNMSMIRRASAMTLPSTLRASAAVAALSSSAPRLVRPSFSAGME